MPYRVELTPAAEREVRRLDPFIRKQVNLDLLCLEENPRPHGAKKIHAQEILYRIDLGPKKNYRAIYQIRDEVLLVLVVRVGSKGRLPPAEVKPFRCHRGEVK